MRLGFVPQSTTFDARAPTLVIVNPTTNHKRNKIYYCIIKTMITVLWHEVAYSAREKIDDVVMEAVSIFNPTHNAACQEPCRDDR